MTIDTSHLMPRKRNVITEQEILSAPCPTCHALEGHRCFVVLDLKKEQSGVDQTFHPERIFNAQNAQIMKHFGSVLGMAEKNMIIYYAFIMLADSVAVQSATMLGKDLSSVEVQKFFAEKAVRELRKDGILEAIKANARS